MKDFSRSLFGFAFLTLITVSKSVRITNLKVPQTYTVDQEKNQEPLTLECEYDLENHEKGFVLKWLFNNICIYQWIPSVKGFALGFMKSRINTTNFSSEKSPGHISIIDPDWNMTGEYTCLVQTFESTDKRAAHMQIIVPESNFGLKLRLDEEEKKVNIFCNVQNVYPKPVITILLNTEKQDEILVKLNKGTDGLYSIFAKAEIPSERMEMPTPITCVFVLTGTNYTKRKETIFCDHSSASTTADPNKEEISSAISRLEAEKGTVDDASNIHKNWLLMSFIVLITLWAFS